MVENSNNKTCTTQVITSVKEITFMAAFGCLSVCLQNVSNSQGWILINFQVMSTMAQGTDHSV